jgi:hypothetical protein
MHDNGPEVRQVGLSEYLRLIGNLMPKEYDLMLLLANFLLLLPHSYIQSFNLDLGAPNHY